MNRGTLMVLKRFFITALGALFAGSAAFVQRARDGSRDAIFGGISQSTHCLTIERGKLMNRGKLMALKRYMTVAALVTFGAAGTVALGQNTGASSDEDDDHTHPVQIPAPEGLSAISSCIAANPAPRGGGGASGSPPDPTDASDNPSVSSLYSVKGNCEFTAAKTSQTIDLAELVDTLGRRLKRLDPGDDDYTDDLAEIRAEFPGPVFDKVVEDFEAYFDAMEDLDDLTDEQGDFNSVTTGSKGAGTLYKEIAASAPGVSGGTVIDDVTSVGFDTTWSDNDTANDTTDDGYILDTDEDLRFDRIETAANGGATGDTSVTFNAKGKITGLTVNLDTTAGSEDVESVETIDFSSTAGRNDLGGDTDADEVWSTLGGILASKKRAEDERDNFQKVLDDDAKGTLTITSGSGDSAVTRSQTLTPAERAHLEKIVAARQSEIDAIDNAIEDIEEFVDPNPNGGTRIYRTLVQNYENGLRDLRALRNAVVDSIDDQKTSNEAVRASIASVVDHLDTLVAVAEHNAANDDLPETTLKALETLRDAARQARQTYIDATSDTENPASALLTKLIEQDNTGQALISAVSDTYGTAKDAKTTAEMAMDAVDGLSGDDGLVAQNTASIENLDGRVAANEGEIWDADGNSRIDANEERSMANAMEIGMDENGMSRIDHNEARSMTNATNIATNATNIMNNAENIMTNANEIMRVEGRVDTNWDAIAANQMAISDNTANISSNADAIAANMNSIGSERQRDRRQPQHDR